MTAVAAALILPFPAAAAGAEGPQRRVIVTFLTGTDPGRQQEVSDSAGTIRRRIDAVRLAVEASEAGVRSLSGNGRVASVEVDHRVRAVGHTTATRPNDPRYPDQWALRDISAPAAWDTTTGSTSVKVAILDTGINKSHPELSGRVVADKNFTTGPTASPTANDLDGHGTMVAGIVGATGNNGTGITGVNWNVSLLNYKILDDSGEGYLSDMAAAIRAATDDGATVINISAAGPNSTSALTDAVGYATARNVLIVAAAGNEGTSRMHYPAALEEVIAVGSTTPTKQRASFSNYGTWVDVAAPGQDIVSTYGSGLFAEGSGTSFSSPLVAGLVALLRSQQPPVATTASGLRCLVINSATAMAGAQLGAGRVQAHIPLTGLKEVPGYILDGWGGLHPIGGAPPASGFPYWPTWDIARDLSYGNGGTNWVLDGFGGLHPYNGGRAITGSAYWPGWDIARAVAARPDGKGVYVLDGWGGIHPAWTEARLATPTPGGYWPGWDIARDIALDPTDPAGGRGWVLDGFGGLHPFGGAPAVNITGYWPGHDIAKKIVLNPARDGTGWVLDTLGGLHRFAPTGRSYPSTINNPSYPSGPARDAVFASDEFGQVVTGFGFVARVPNRSCSEVVRWPGWDIVRAFAPTST